MSLSGGLRQSNIVLAGLVVVALCVILRIATTPKKANVPVVGSSALFGYVGALKSTTFMREYLMEGYQKYKSHAFQVPALRSWQVFVSGKFIDEIRKAPDDTLSFREAINDILATEYTLGKAHEDNPWHVPVIRKQLTSNLGAVFPAIYDEIKCAFEDAVGITNDGEWKAVAASEMVLQIVCRASNRLFVGLPLCRDPEYTAIIKEYTVTLVMSGLKIVLFPSFLRPLAARFVNKVPEIIPRFEKFVVPLVNDRYSSMALHGDDWKDRPNDLLQWLLDTAEGDERTPEAITRRVLTLNFAAIHTSSMSFTQALYYLAANPQSAKPLRAEVEDVVKEHGWTKEGINAMIKVDSFLKEMMRMTGLGAASMPRKVLKRFSFSDGTVLPVGSSLSVNSYATHHDPDLYPDPDTFDPFRFSRPIEQGDNPAKYLFTTTGPHFLPFGHGGHACPGRFFASQELKAMLAHIVLHYDVRMSEGVRPAERWLMQACIPDRTAKVLFRKRLV